MIGLLLNALLLAIGVGVGVKLGHKRLAARLADACERDQAVRVDNQEYFLSPAGYWHRGVKLP